MNGAPDTPDSDIALVQRVQKGDARAFDLLVLKYQRRVERLISRFVRDPDLVPDIAQEAFIRAYRALPQFRGESAFYTWLYRIAVNTAKKQLMALGRDPVITESALADRREEEDETSPPALEQRDDETPEAVLAGKEVDQALLERQARKVGPQASREDDKAQVHDQRRGPDDRQRRAQGQQRQGGQLRAAGKHREGHEQGHGRRQAALDHGHARHQPPGRNRDRGRQHLPRADRKFVSVQRGHILRRPGWQGDEVHEGGKRRAALGGRRTRGGNRSVEVRAWRASRRDRHSTGAQ